jgi:hypothetical protein
MRARRPQRCCHRRETHLSAQPCLSSPCPSMNNSNLFPACARAREKGARNASIAWSIATGA